MKQQKTVIYIASTFAILLWGMSYIWTDKLINLGIPIFYFVFVRILLAGIILFLFNTASSRIKRIQRRDLPKFLLLSLCEPFIYFLCETYGLKETGSPTLSAMVVATIPIFSIGAGILFFKEKINAINIAGILLSLVGIVMVAMAKGELGENFMLGILFLLIAVLSEVGHASITNYAFFTGGGAHDEGIMDDRAPPMKKQTSPATNVPPQKTKNPSPVMREINNR